MFLVAISEYDQTLVESDEVRDYDQLLFSIFHGHTCEYIIIVECFCLWVWTLLLNGACSLYNETSNILATGNYRSLENFQNT